MRRAEIVATDKGFVILGVESTETVLLDDVTSVVAYKRDQLTVDLVCCDVFTRIDDRTLVRTIDEDLPGFNDVMVRLKTLPGFNRRWREAVISPAFAESRTSIYERASDSAGNGE